MKRNARAMQDRTGRHRHLMPARPALKKFSIAQLVRLGVSTSWTLVAIRPAALAEVPATVVFVTKRLWNSAKLRGKSGRAMVRTPSMTREQNVELAESTG